MLMLVIMYLYGAFLSFKLFGVYMWIYVLAVVVGDFSMHLLHKHLVKKQKPAIDRQNAFRCRTIAHRYAQNMEDYDRLLKVLYEEFKVPFEHQRYFYDSYYTSKGVFKSEPQGNETETVSVS